jgi:tripeptide aminopeptidase
MIRTLFTAACLVVSATAHAQTPLPPISSETDAAFRKLLDQNSVKQVLDFLKKDDAPTLKDQIELTEIPSPPFKESVRAAEFLKRMRAVGFADSRIDTEGNVIAVRKGSGNGPVLVLSAHMDTVFPEGTDVKVKIKGDRYEAPGIYDDGRGLATLLSIGRALKNNDIRTAGDIVFVGTVGEEELGDLRGVKALFRDNKAIDGFISLDGTDIERVINQATGSRRYRIIYTGPGGHSFSAFGLPSATHALGRAIAKISEVRTPANPKTTFTVGTLKGGTSVNAIAADAELGLDMRSNSAEELKRLETQIMALARQAADEENKRWGDKEVIKVEFKLVGDRPAGTGSVDTPLVHASRRAVAAVGGEVKNVMASSTDSNTPIGMGIPAVTLGGGGVGGGSHGPGEWYTPKNAWLGPQFVFLTTLSLVGMEGVAPPLLARRPR